jgi:hypothetical protein
MRTEPRGESKQGGKAELARPAPGLLTVCFTGHLTDALMESLDARLADALVSGDARVIVFDAIGVTGFDVATRRSGLALLQRVHASGAVAVTAVTAAGVRMMASAIAFAAGLTMRLVATRDEADRFAKEELARAKGARR